MATLRHTVSQAVVTTDDESAKKLVASGEWAAADAPKRRAPRKAVEAVAETESE